LIKEYQIKHKGFILIPCFNEEERLKVDYFSHLQREVDVLTDSFNFQVQFKFIDDGSTDGTNKLLISLCKEIPASLLTLKQNVGKGNAIRLGILEVLPSKPEFIAYLDSDGAFKETDVARGILKYVEDYHQTKIDLVSFARISMAGTTITRNKFRHIVGRLIATILNINSGYIFYDSQTGFKIYRGAFLHGLDLEARLKTKWFIDWEIILRSPTQVRIIEVPVSNWRDVQGSNLSILNVASVLLEILRVKRLQRGKT
jgi:glycosyltransferase involved in cell wall biosynthesis